MPKITKKDPNAPKGKGKGKWQQMTRGNISGNDAKKKEWTKKPQLKFVPPHRKKLMPNTKEESEGIKAANEAPPTRQRDEEEGGETKAAEKKKTAKEEWEQMRKMIKDKSEAKKAAAAHVPDAAEGNTK